MQDAPALAGTGQEPYVALAMGGGAVVQLASVQQGRRTKHVVELLQDFFYIKLI